EAQREFPDAIAHGWIVPGRAEPEAWGSAPSVPDRRADSIASMSRLAEAAVSSTATREPGPAVGSTKSTFSVCSAIACTGWSKYTTASVRWTQRDSGPLALPSIGSRYVA